MYVCMYACIVIHTHALMPTPTNARDYYIQYGCMTLNRSIFRNVPLIGSTHTILRIHGFLLSVAEEVCVTHKAFDIHKILRLTRPTLVPEVFFRHEERI